MIITFDGLKIYQITNEKFDMKSVLTEVTLINGDIDIETEEGKSKNSISFNGLADNLTVINTLYSKIGKSGTLITPDNTITDVYLSGISCGKRKGKNDGYSFSLTFTLGGHF